MRKILFGLWLLLSCTVSAKTCCESQEWLPFRTTLRGEAIQWTQQSADLSRSVAILEVTVPVYRNLSVGGAATLSQLSITNTATEFSAKHRPGYGASIEWSDIQLTNSMYLNFSARADAARQVLDDQFMLGGSPISRKQALTAYHFESFATLSHASSNWEFHIGPGVVGDRLDRRIELAGVRSDHRTWSGMQPAGSIELVRNWNRYNVGCRVLAGAEQRLGVSITIGQDER